MFSCKLLVGGIILDLLFRFFEGYVKNINEVFFVWKSLILFN